MRADQFINEITKIPAGSYTGGKSSLADLRYGDNVQKLPGRSGLLYSVVPANHMITNIKLWDPKGPEYLAKKAKKQTELPPKPVRRRGEFAYEYDLRLEHWQSLQNEISVPGQLIGLLQVSNARRFPMENALMVETITVDEDYRGVGIAKALYGIVLSIMKRPLLAGEYQTPGGRKNWVSISKIPGVEMKGYVRFSERELDNDKNIDIIMGKLGGQYMGPSPVGSSHVFAFDVMPNTTEKELEAYVNTKLNNVYGGGNDYGDNVGLFAVWTGK